MLDKQTTDVIIRETKQRKTMNRNTNYIKYDPETELFSFNCLLQDELNALPSWEQENYYEQEKIWLSNAAESLALQLLFKDAKNQVDWLTNPQ